MINISLRDLMVGTERPAPRTALRSEAPAFDVLLDRGDAKRTGAAGERARDRVADAREPREPSRRTTTDQRDGAPAAEKSSAREDGAATEAARPAGRSARREDDVPVPGDDGSSKPASGESPNARTATTQAGDHPSQPSQPSDELAATAADSSRAATIPTAATTSAILPSQTSGAPGMAGVNASSALDTDIAGNAPAQPAGQNAAGAQAAAKPEASAAGGAAPFAASLLAQSATAEGPVTPAAGPQQQAGTAPLAGPAATDPSLAQGPKPGPATAAMQHSAAQARAQLGALLDLQNIDVEISQASDALAAKPLPSLANGMIAQLGLAHQSDGKTVAPAAAAPDIAPINSPATATASPTQIAAAVAPVPPAQQVVDEPRAKAAVAPDGMAIQAPAPAAAGHTGQSAAANPAAPARFTLPAQPAADQVAVHIAKAAAEGADKINIKLKPASLGQIEVQLDVAPDGRVHAVIAADKPETLDLLQRDARGLERALNDAGLRADSGSLSFNLRGQNQQFDGMSGGGGSAGGSRHAADRTPAIEPSSAASRIGAYLNTRAASGGVDIQV